MQEVLLLAIVFIRTVILYILTILSLRLMGKRQIGELEPSELVVTILISELVTIPMQDLDYPLMYAFIPILALVAMEVLSSSLLLKSRIFRSFLAGSYSVIIYNGKIDQKEMGKSQLTIDELMEELRQNGALSLDEVKFCILETSGKISVMLKADCQTEALPVMVIVDGKIVKENLQKAGLDQPGLTKILKSYHVENEKDVFCMSICNGNVVLVKKEI